MPVFHRSRDGSDATVETVQDGQPRTFRLAREGALFLTDILQLRDGDECRPSDLQLLLDRGWAEPAVEAPEPEPTPTPIKPPPAPPRPAPAPAPRPAAPAPTAASSRPPVRRTGSGPVASSSARASQAAASGTPAPTPTAPRATTVSGSRPGGSEIASGTALTRRTRGREVALQVLYLMEQNAGVARGEMDRFIQRRIRDPKLVVFARALVDGVTAQKPGIDELIGQVAENWRLDRMAAIDRNILRLGAYEMLHCPEVPRKVAINEALELAKRYSTAQSSRFVNGILDRLQASTEGTVAGDETASPAQPAGEGS